MISKDIKLSVFITDDNVHDHTFIKTAMADYKQIRFVSFFSGNDLLNAIIPGKSGNKTKPPAAPDLILLDINMPGLSGFEVLEVLCDKSVIDLKRVVILSTCIELDLKNCSKFDIKAYNKPESFSSYKFLICRIIEDFVSDFPVSQEDALDLSGKS